MPLPGEIVLAAFPFADLSAVKRRPCVVLAATETLGDFVVAFVTSANSAQFPRFGVVVEPSHPDWKQTRLKVPSAIRVDKLCTLNTRVMSGRLGSLSPVFQEALKNQLRLLFSM